MGARFYAAVTLMIGFTLLMMLALLFHWGAVRGFFNVEQDLMGIAMSAGSLLTLFMAFHSRSLGNGEPWSHHERLGWSLIGGGLFIWVIGGYLSGYAVLTGRELVFSWTSFLPDEFCFAIGILLIFFGLLFLPSATTGAQHVLLLLDSLISAGSCFAIAWFLLLGSLALLPGKSLSTRLLNIFYPAVDMVTVCSLFYLLLNIFADRQRHPTPEQHRGISVVYRISLLILSIGLLLFEIMTFLETIQVEFDFSRFNPSWEDIVLAVSVMMVGLAAYLRRFLPAMDEKGSPSAERFSLHLPQHVIQFVPYLLVIFPLLVLTLNVLSPQPDQQATRPILTLVTLLVVVLVLIREIVTMQENEHLVQEQTVTLEQLKRASQELAQHGALRAELSVAAKIQAQLLPQKLPEVQGLDLFASSLPMGQVGGDFYDVFAQREAPFVFTLGDISGHGLPAALLMTMTRTIFHTATRSLSLIDPQTILQRTNEDLYEDFTEVGMFITVFVGRYDVRSSQLTYANAGHSPVIYCPRGGSATLLMANAPVLGILPTTSYTNQIVPFHEDDVLLVGTDGLNESFNQEGEMFGYERLLKTVETLAHLPAREMGMELLRTIEHFTQGSQQSDDQTLLVLKGIDPGGK